MLTRFGMGLIKGLLVGGLLLAALVFGGGFATVPVWVGYLLTIVAGALTGLVAGKPIWQGDARIEAGLKAVAGAVLAPLALLALRKWGPQLPVLPRGNGVGADPLVGMSVVAIPMVTTALAMLFELDNTPEPEKPAGSAGAAGGAKGGGASKVRVASGGAGVDDESLAELDDAGESPASRQGGRRGGR